MPCDEAESKQILSKRALDRSRLVSPMSCATNSSIQKPTTAGTQFRRVLSSQQHTSDTTPHLNLMEDIFTQLKKIKNPPTQQDRPKTQANINGMVRTLVPVLAPMTPPCQIGSYDSFPCKAKEHVQTVESCKRGEKLEVYLDLESVIRRVNVSQLEIKKDD